MKQTTVNVMIKSKRCILRLSPAASLRSEKSKRLTFGLNVRNPQSAFRNPQ